jgi:PncC family amidohydrolase
MDPAVAPDPGAVPADAAPDDRRRVAAELHQRLLARGETLAVAESLTGGGLSDLVSGVPGVSATFRGGVVSYATDVKRELLGVRAETLREHGAVSAACAAEMAVAVRRLLGASWGVSTTGVAGPDPQEGKPAGRVFVGVAGPDDTPQVHELLLAGSREEIRRATCDAALSAVLAAVVGLVPGPEG